MKQRLLIARALLGEPRVLLLDEPTRSLDPLLAREFRRFLREELGERQGCTVLLATHDAEEALEVCTRVGVLHRGRLLAVGTVDELSAQVSDAHYRLLATAAAAAPLAALEARGQVTQVTEGEADDEGWRRYDVYVPGGREEAAHALAAVTGAGAPVAHFERVELGLAELLERIVTRSADAEAHDDAAEAPDGA